MIPFRNYQEENCYEHLYTSSEVLLAQGVNVPLLT